MELEIKLVCVRKISRSQLKTPMLRIMIIIITIIIIILIIIKAMKDYG